MPLPRSRRIVRRGLLAVAGVVLALAAYVASFVGLAWLAGHGSVSGNTVNQIDRSVYAPIVLWSEYRLPGTDALAKLRNRVYWIGRGAPDPMDTPWGAGEPV